jgi:hypothetical protein
MRVICRRSDGSTRLTSGETYLVLAMLLATDPGGMQALVLDNTRSPTWFDTTLFSTSTELIPPSWVARIDEDGAVHIAPAAWLESGFWEAFYDGPDELRLRARQIFRVELAKIEDAESPNESARALPT